MADDLWKVADESILSGRVPILQEHLLREPIQIVAIWKTVVISYLIVEWTYLNGAIYLGHKPAYHPPTHPLQIPHISMSYIVCDREM